MKHAQLKRIGKRRFGQYWQAALGAAVGKSRITVWRWATGKLDIPDKMAEKILELEKAPE